jgi:glycosyltransferase involved in cell wall biosynthesis
MAELGRSAREARSAAAAASRSLPRSRRPACFSERWNAGTVYCSAGADWLDGDLSYLAERRDARAFTTVLTVYDLIPMVVPQFVRPEHELEQHFVQLVELADRILVISESTASDLRLFASSRDLVVPPLVKIPLGGELSQQARSAPSDPVLAHTLRHGFVLVVGTVEIRKNHHLLLDVWEMMLADRGPQDTPRLVIAGQRGWLATETVARITRTPAFEGVVHFFEGPSDRELAWLYEHCTFTVFPARYEGWGLPVSESLDFGKLCLTGDGSSLAEAGEGLTELLDPFDRSLWKERILHYWSDRVALGARERDIVNSHQPVTARQTADAVIAAVRAATRAAR